MQRICEDQIDLDKRVLILGLMLIAGTRTGRHLLELLTSDQGGDNNQQSVHYYHRDRLMEDV